MDFLNIEVSTPIVYCRCRGLLQVLNITGKKGLYAPFKHAPKSVKTTSSRSTTSPVPTHGQKFLHSGRHRPGTPLPRLVLIRAHPFSLQMQSKKARFRGTYLQFFRGCRSRLPSSPAATTACRHRTPPQPPLPARPPPQQPLPGSPAAFAPLPGSPALFPPVVGVSLRLGQRGDASISRSRPRPSPQWVSGLDPPLEASF